MRTRGRDIFEPTHIKQPDATPKVMSNAKDIQSAKSLNSSCLPINVILGISIKKFRHVSHSKIFTAANVLFALANFRMKCNFE